MTQKTAMQEVYDKLNSTNVTIKELFNWLADNETRLLAKELKKQDIVDAWQDGYNNGCVVGGNDYTNETEEDNGEFYYNQKYTPPITGS